MDKMLLVSKNLPQIGCRLDYYIIQDDYSEVVGIISSKVFGIEVQKICRDELDVEYIQKRTIYDLSCDKKRVEEFIHLLSENDVTPVTLFDIVTDKLDEGYFENIYYLIDQPA